MSFIKVIKFVNGVPKEMNPNTDSLMALSFKVGGVNGTELTKQILDTIIGGGDAGGLHHHDGRYYTKEQVDAAISAAVQSTNDASEIAYSNSTSGMSATTVQGAIDELDGEVDELKVRVTDAEGRIDDLESGLSSEQSARESADAGLQSQIDSLSSQLSSEQSSRQSADSQLSSQISSEEAARQAADSALSGRLDVLESDSVTKTYVDTQDAAKLAEAKSYTDQKVAELVDSAPEALNTLRELAEALGSDPNLAASISTQLGTLDNKIDQEIADRISGDSDLAIQISSEISRAQSAENTLQNAIAAEQNRAQIAEGLLQDAIDAESAARDAGDIALNVRVDTVEQSIVSAQTELQGNIDAEELARQTADAGLQASIDLINNTPVQQVIYVAKNGNDALGKGTQQKPYLTIEFAQDSITDASPTKRYVIMIAPGTYTEASTFNFKANVAYVGMGNRNQTVISKTSGVLSTTLNSNNARITIMNVGIFGGGATGFEVSNSGAGSTTQADLFNVLIGLPFTTQASVSHINNFRNVVFIGASYGSSGPVTTYLQASQVSTYVNHGDATQAAAGTDQGALVMVNSFQFGTPGSNMVNVQGATYYHYASFVEKLTFDKKATDNSILFDSSFPQRSNVTIVSTSGQVKFSDVENMIFAPAVSSDWSAVPSNPKAALDELASRMKAEEQALAQEIVNRQASDASLETEIQGVIGGLASEVSARQAQDIILQTNIDTVSSALSTETAARQSGDTYLQGQITQEISDRQSADSALNTRLLVLEQDPTTKTYVDGKISYLLSNTTPEALDSFTEVVAAFQAADSNINDAIMNLSASASSALAAEVSRAQAAEADLQTQITAEVSRAQSAEAALQSEIDQVDVDLQAEIANRTAADTAMAQNLQSEINARIAADSDLQGQISQLVTDLGAETQARISSDADLQSQITQEISDRQMADANLQSQIDAEFSARQSADTGLQMAIDAEMSARDVADQNLQSQITQEVSNRQTADQDLQNSIFFINDNYLQSTYNLMAGEALLAGDLVVVMKDGSNVPVAMKASSAASSNPDFNDGGKWEVLGMVKYDTLSGETVSVQRYGNMAVNFESAPSVSDIGKSVYLSTTSGKAVVYNAPTGAGDGVVYLGRVVSLGTLHFMGCHLRSVNSEV